MKLFSRLASFVGFAPKVDTPALPTPAPKPPPFNPESTGDNGFTEFPLQDVAERTHRMTDLQKSVLAAAMRKAAAEDNPYPRRAGRRRGLLGFPSARGR